MTLSITLSGSRYRYLFSALALVLVACHSSGGHHGSDNAAPMAAADSATTLDLSPVTIDVLANDSDPESDTLTISSVSAAAHGNAGISDGKILYTPTVAFSGDDSFSYSISDGHSHTVQAQVTVHRSNSPQANNDELSVNSFKPVTAAILSNDSDLDGDSFSLTEVGTSDYATLAISSNKIVYTPTKTLVGDDHVSYTISDTAGHTGTAQLTIHANNALHLQGKVALSSASPLASATITASVGAVTSNATANADGSFDIGLSGLSTTDTGLVSIVASGSGALDSVKLAAYIGDYAELYKQGGSARIVNSNQNSMLKVTPMSTSWVANVDVTNSATVTDNATFLRLLGEVDSHNVFQTAALVKIAADAIAAGTVGLQLPDGVSDTLALVRNANNVTQYYGLVVQHDFPSSATSIADTIKAIQADSLTSMSIDAAGLVGQLFYSGPVQQGGEILTLQNDGKGYISWGQIAFGLPNFTTPGAVGLTWSVASPNVSLSFAAPKLLFDADEYDAVLDQLVYRQKYLTGMDVQVLAKFNGRLIIARTVHLHVVVPDHAIPDYDETLATDLRVGTAASVNIALIEADLPGTWYLPMLNLTLNSQVDTLDRFGRPLTVYIAKQGFSGKFVFNADHTVTMPEVAFFSNSHWAASATWNIDLAGTLHIAFTDPNNGHAMELRYVRMSALEHAGLFSLKYIDTVSGSFSSTTSEGGKLDDGVAWQESNVPGIYSSDDYAMIGLNHFWFELNADHSGKYVSVFDNNNDGIAQDNEFFINQVKWQINDDGSLTITRYRDRSTHNYCEPFFGSPTCVPDQIRTLTPMERAGNRVYFHRDLQTNYMFSQTMFFINETENFDTYHWTKLNAAPLTLPSALARTQTNAVKGKAGGKVKMDSRDIRR